MKRLLAAFLMLLLLAGCAAESGSEAPGVDVYYLSAEGDFSGGSAVGKVTYTVRHEGDLLHEALVRLMEDPAGPMKMRSAFPSDLHINTYSLEGREIVVDLTESYLSLEPVKKTLVRCCLVLTLCSLQEVDAVSISVEGRMLEEGLTQDILLMESTSESEYQTELELWFPAGDGSCLLPERRQLTIAQNKQLAEYAVGELLRGPQRGDAAAAMPEGTALIGVQVSKGLCTVDFSAEFERNKPTSPSQERLMLYALTNTLTELPGVEAVEISVEGSPLRRYAYIDLTSPLAWAEEFTYPCLQKWNWFTVNLYLKGADGRLVAVPVPADDEDYPNTLTVTGQALELLLSLNRTWGYERPVPSGTRLLGLEVEDRICTLELSREFLGGDQRQRTLAAESMAATAIDIGGYQGVRIRVESMLYADGQLFRKEGEWFVEG